jgi:hypothetical protein
MKGLPVALCCPEHTTRVAGVTELLSRPSACLHAVTEHQSLLVNTVGALPCVADSRCRHALKRVQNDHQRAVEAQAASAAESAAQPAAAAPPPSVVVLHPAFMHLPAAAAPQQPSPAKPGRKSVCAMSRAMSSRLCHNTVSTWQGMIWICVFKKEPPTNAKTADNTPVQAPSPQPRRQQLQLSLPPPPLYFASWRYSARPPCTAACLGARPGPRTSQPSREYDEVTHASHTFISTFSVVERYRFQSHTYRY